MDGEEEETVLCVTPDFPSAMESMSAVCMVSGSTWRGDRQWGHAKVCFGHILAEALMGSLSDCLVGEGYTSLEFRFPEYR